MPLKERVAVFIDGSNLYHSLKHLNVERIDFQKFTESLVGERELVLAFYYNAPLDISINAEKYWDQQRFFNTLRKIPKFNVVLGRMRKIIKNGKVTDFEVKGDDVNLVVDMVSCAYENLYDTAIIVSGDEDFVPAIKKLQKLDKKVENAYFNSSSSTALKHASNFSICINKIIKEII